MPNSFFQFKQFIVHHDRCAMKVTTDACLFGAWVAEEIRNSKNNVQNMLDVGCGTGLLSLMIAQKNEITIDAIEINTDAAEQAKQNTALSKWKNRIAIIQGDVLQWEPAKKYDCIVSNPPFYETELKSPQQTKNIAHHDDGLKLSELFGFIKNNLTENGIFFLLLPAKRKAELKALLHQHNFFSETEIEVKQTVNHSPFRLMIKAGRKTQPAIAEEISIKDESNEYTARFTQLLKEYYLYL